MKQSIAMEKSGNQSYENEEVTAFIRKYMAYLYGTAMKLLKDENLADDCVQIVFEKISRSDDRICAMDEPQRRSYLYKTTKSSAIDILRKERRWVLMEAGALEVLIDSCRVDEILAEEDWSEWFQEILAELSEEERWFLMCKYQDQMTYAEIAEELGISEEACKKRGQRLKEKIARKILEKKGDC